MVVLCLGPKGAGKTLLLNSLQNPGSINNTSNSVVTVGINIFTIKFPQSSTITTTATTSVGVGPSQKSNRPTGIQIQEIGGTLAPMWKNYFTNVDKIMYVVDTSNLCNISAAGVLLYSLVSDPRLKRTKFLLVLTKMDLAYRQMRNEALLMLQMAKLRKEIHQTIDIVETSAIDGLNHDKIVFWLKK